MAVSAEEMSASTREIAQQSAEAAKVASEAATVAARPNGTISKLGDSSVEISNVIKVITFNAQQRNLPALNATVEAPRAGETGESIRCR